MNLLIVAASTVVTAVIVAIIARRLLGAPVGWPRTIVICLIGNSLVGLILRRVADGLGISIDEASATSDPLPILLVSGLVIGWSLVVEIMILAVLEAVLPTGSFPGPIQLLRSIPARARRARRYTEVVRIAARHGLVAWLRPRANRHPDDDVPVHSRARALRRALEDAGVTFVKLGQMLATRPDIVPPAIVSELSSLHADVPALSWTDVRPVIDEALGRPLEEVFASVDTEPFAAASVAQVHTARLLNGTDVVLKVQRPGAREQVTGDMDIVLRLADRLYRTTRWGRALGLRTLARGFADSLEEELDYRVELANMQAVGGAIDSALIDVPTPYPDLSSQRLLVMERIDGAPLSSAGDGVRTLTGQRRHDLAQALVGTILRQVLVTGVFHADLHPGNVMLRPTGTLALLDLGSVGRLDSASRTTLGTVLTSVERGDAIAATDAIVQLLDRPAGLDDRDLERDIGQLLTRLGHAPESSALFGDLLTIVLRHRFSVPPQLAGAFRALGGLEGTLALLRSDLDLMGAARAEGRTIAREKVSPQALKDSLVGQAAALMPVLQRMPRRLGRITEDLEAGRFTISTRVLAHEDDRAFVSGIVQQVITAVLAASLGLAGTILIASTGGPSIADGIEILPLVGAALLLFAFTLGARILVRVFLGEQDQARRRRSRT
ncbi:Ubiquinone biosynthesis monooxygenase UbiB [Actinomycetales bacterium JB111]|nr:Ubiquinone biosynthesis monooxygenase UbiB [Actinomycetales bacterium JB111]